VLVVVPALAKRYKITISVDDPDLTTISSTSFIEDIVSVLAVGVFDFENCRSVCTKVLPTFIPNLTFLSDGKVETGGRLALASKLGRVLLSDSEVLAVGVISDKLRQSQVVCFGEPVA